KYPSISGAFQLHCRHGLAGPQFDMSKICPFAVDSKSAHLVSNDNILSVAIPLKHNADALEIIDEPPAIFGLHEADPSQFIVAAKRLVRDLRNKSLPSTGKPLVDCLNPNDRGDAFDQHGHESAPW